MYSLWAILVALLVGLGSYQEPAGAADYKVLGAHRTLRKLKRKLTGLTVTAEERAELNKFLAGNGQKDLTEFLEKKTDEYTSNPAFVEKYAYLLEALISIQTHYVPPALEPVLKPRANSMSRFLRTVLLENRSWDELLTGSTFDINADYESVQDDGSLSDFEFFGSSGSNLKSVATNVRTQEVAAGQMKREILEFPIASPVAGGILTMPRFWKRFSATPSNQNRRFSQAVFRIFLCDPVKAIAIAGSDDDKNDEMAVEAVRKLLRENDGQVTQAQVDEAVQAASLEKQHGNDPNCMACHYKLDPMGRAFGTPGNKFPSTVPFAGDSQEKLGMLTFKQKSDDQLVKIPSLRGIGDLGRAITGTKDYAECQAEHFWKWTIGTQVKLSVERKKELAAVFTSANIGRRPKDFLKHLVTQKEFKYDVTDAYLNPVEQKVKFEEVKPLLSQCNTCHVELDWLWDFTKRPYSTSAKISEKERLEAMLFRLTLPNDDSRKMPMNWSEWKPEELRSIVTWLKSAIDGTEEK